MKIALVTGASSGLGREFVRQIAEQGKVEEIWAIARRRDRLEALQSISAVPIRVLALDLTRPGDMEYLRNTLQDELPDIRILVNAAGMGRMGPTVDIPAKDNETSAPHDRPELPRRRGCDRCGVPLSAPRQSGTGDLLHRGVPAHSGAERIRRH